MYRVWTLSALLDAPAAHADPVGWSYAWSTTTAAVPGDQGNSGEVIFTANPGGHATGLSAVTAAAVSTLSDAPKPFVGTADADSILDRIKWVCEGTSDSGH